MVDETRLGQLLAGVRGARPARPRGAGGPGPRPGVSGSGRGRWPQEAELTSTRSPCSPPVRACASWTPPWSARRGLALMDVGTLVARAGRRFGDRLAVEGPDGDRTFAELGDRVARIAHGLLAARAAPGRPGAGPADQLSTAYLESDLAIRSAGLVRAALNHRLHPTRLGADRRRLRCPRPGLRRPLHRPGRGVWSRRSSTWSSSAASRSAPVEVDPGAAGPAGRPDRGRRASRTRCAACTTPPAPPAHPRAPSARTATGWRRWST